MNLAMRRICACFNVDEGLEIKRQQVGYRQGTIRIKNGASFLRTNILLLIC